MWQVKTLRSDISTHATFISSSALASTTTPIVKVSNQDNFTISASAADGFASSFGRNPFRRISNDKQRGPRLTSAGRARRHAVAAAVAAPSEPALDPAPETDAAVPLDTNVGEPANAAPEPAPDNGGGNDRDKGNGLSREKYTVHIEALENFELLRFIPVTIEPLGEWVFVAEASELNLSMTGRTPDDAVNLLKDAITRTYESNRKGRNGLDQDRRRQQRILETYIGKPKGTWHWA
jgi:hypothetical protein